MTTQQAAEGPYTYSRGTDGCDETIDICDARGRVLTRIHFWEQAERAEADAKRIVHGLNNHISSTEEQL